MSTNRAIIGGDLLWAVNGDCRTSFPARVVVGFSLKKIAKKATSAVKKTAKNPLVNPIATAKTLAKGKAGLKTFKKAAFSSANPLNPLAVMPGASEALRSRAVRGAVKKVASNPFVNPIATAKTLARGKAGLRTLKRGALSSANPLNPLAAMPGASEAFKRAAKKKTSPVKNAVTKLASNRAKVAQKRLAERPQAAQLAARKAATKLRAVPPAARKAVVQKLVATPPEQGGPTEEQLQDVSDAAWETAEVEPQEDNRGYLDTEGEEVSDEPLDEDPLDEEPLDEEPLDEEPLDEEPLDEEPLDDEPLDEEELSGDDLLGWSPIAAIKKAVKSPLVNPVQTFKMIKKGPRGIVATLKKDPIANPLPLAKKLVASKMVKAGAAGLAVVYPPIGVPAVAALAVAAKVAESLNSVDAARREVAKKLVANTAHEAIVRRDPAALRMIGMMAFNASLARRAA